jgi:hypothetical protein
MQGVFLLCLCLLIAFGACRRNQPSLVDQNEEPDTQLWYAPPDSTDYEYLVHLYWRGEDPDGTAMSFIWTVQDTLVQGELSWDPANRLRDFREGRITERTDSVFSFTAFRDVGGVGVKKNRQAFYIAAIDDNGVIDPTPASVEFIATIDQLPRINFTTHIAGSSQPYAHLDVPKDTVGVMTPFAISYHGVTTNGVVRAYKYYSLTTDVILDGENVWGEDLTDTLRTLSNDGADLLPAKIFKFVAQCKDDANAESPVDAGQYRVGVCQVVVNYDPDTAINNLHSRYTTPDGSGGTTVLGEDIDFNDGVPDTVPYDSWVRLDYSGWDDSRDGKISCSPLYPDSCIGFHVAYWKESRFNNAATEFSLWQPRDGVHDTDEHSSTDSNTYHIGSLEYELFVRAVDENERPDGTPPSVPVIGNFDPTLDSLAVEDHLGNRINLGVLDTLTWNFWKGEGWPYVCACDTFDMGQAVCDAQALVCQGRTYPNHRGTFDWVKSWSFHIKGWGHDHPKDPPPSNKDPLGSGLKSWQYMVMNSQGQFINLGKSSPSFFEYKIDGDTQINVLDDVIGWRKTYPSDITGPAVGYPNGDIYGCTVFEALPSWLDDEMTFFLLGKDTLAQSTYEFDQGIFINGVYNVINQFPDASLGRRTEQQVFAFVVRLVRPGPPDVCP